MNKPTGKVTASTVQDELDAMDALTEEEIAARRARNIAQRLNAVMAEVEYVQKERPKSGMQYSYVSHDAVTKLVRPILQAHGVVYYPRNLQVSQNGNRTEAIFTVRFENIDDRSDYIDVETVGYGVDNQDKGPGKAMSYGVKYALLKALGLETGDDPEAVQDERADHRPTTGETPPRKSVKLDGPYTCPSQLKAAAKAFDNTLRNISDMGELIAWEKTKDYTEFVEQCQRDMPEWWEAGEGMPAEFVPLVIRVANKRRELEELETVRG